MSNQRPSALLLSLARLLERWEQWLWRRDGRVAKYLLRRCQRAHRRVMIWLYPQLEEIAAEVYKRLLQVDDAVGAADPDGCFTRIVEQVAREHRE